jgi:hypothetical protein
LTLAGDRQRGTLLFVLAKMKIEELKKAGDQRPFRPFTLVTADGLRIRAYQRGLDL